MSSVTKVCSKCREELPLDGFYRNRKQVLGRDNWCKRCVSGSRKAKRMADPGVRAADRARYARDKVRIRAYQNEYQRAVYWASPEKHRAAGREWYWNHYAAGRVASIRARVGEVNQDAADYIGVLIVDPCCYCGAPGEHVDHIIAISAGGSSEWDNLTSACSACNRVKHNKPLLEFLLQAR